MTAATATAVVAAATATAATAMDGDASIADDGVHVCLTHAALDPAASLRQVGSAGAGATVLFVGTTRDSTGGRPVRQLHFDAYLPLAVRTLAQIARAARSQFALAGISIAHRLGVVPVGEASIVVAVAAPHRQPAWQAGQAALEQCKRRLEVWKLEEFDDGGAEWVGEKAGGHDMDDIRTG